MSNSPATTFAHACTDTRPDSVIKKREVAVTLGVTVRTVERFRAAGLLTAAKLSARGAVRFARSEVARYLAAASDEAE